MERESTMEVVNERRVALLQELKLRKDGCNRKALLQELNYTLPALLHDIEGVNQALCPRALIITHDEKLYLLLQAGLDLEEILSQFQ